MHFSEQTLYSAIKSQLNNNDNTNNAHITNNNNDSNNTSAETAFSPEETALQSLNIEPQSYSIAFLVCLLVNATLFADAWKQYQRLYIWSIYSCVAIAKTTFNYQHHQQIFDNFDSR